MKKLSHILLSFIVFVMPNVSFGQEAEEAATSVSIFEQYQVEIVLGFAVIVCLVCIFAMYALLVAMRTILKLLRKEQGVEVPEPQLIAVKEGEDGVDFWGRFWNRVNVSVPIANEASVATDHEYDGIKELDNRLPPWWLYGFYFTIAFGVVYLINFLVLKTGPTQDQEFRAEMLKAKEDVKIYLASMDNLIDENSVELTQETTDLNIGREIFDANCAVCHRKDGGGNVGPNFTDQYWLHGGDMASIFKTIKYGVPEKGMISWEAQLSPKKMQQVASYIYMMEGTNPVDPKAPQGELFIREDAAATSVEDSVSAPADSLVMVDENEVVDAE